jgi:DNA-binding LacI/PurR family transcriptional regulator
MTVAKEAKVSHMTVTRVLRGEGNVSEGRRVRVLKAMERLGYVPSPIKRGVRSKDRLRWSGGLCFALIFGAYTQVADEFFCAVTRGAEQGAAKNGLCLVQVHWQATEFESWPRMQPVLAMEGFCGAVLVGQFARHEIEKIMAHAGNVVVIDAPAPEDLPVGSVESENFRGCLLALEHLVKGGAKRILVLTGPADHYFSQIVAMAAQTFRGKGRTIDIMETDYSPGGAQTAVEKLWGEGKRYDGIFGNDEMAIGVMRGLADMKVDVPGEVRVVGFDDISYGAFSSPRLTTVSIDKHRLGFEAVETLVAMVRKEGKGEQIKKIIKAKLVVRESA